MPLLWDKIRSDFPITQQCVYLDHAAGGPVARPVLEAVETYYRENALEADFAWTRWMRRRESVREKVAQFIGARPEEITFVQGTSHGVNLAAELLAGQGTVLTNTSEFPSSTLPWIWRKADLVWQEPDEGALSLEKFRSLLSPSVKTVLTSYVQYATGFRQDLKKIGILKGDRFLAVNATQGLGAFPLNVEECRIDFLAANSYKWLMAGYGGGILYVRKKWLEKFQPSSIGWRSVQDPEAMNNRGTALKEEASRYEGSCPSFPTIFAVGAAVEYLSQIGIEKIGRRILELTEFLIRGLEKQGREVVSPRARHQRSGIVVFRMKNPGRVWKKLLREKVYVSPRGAGIRVAPHFYNSFEEIEIFLKKLKRLA